MDRDVFFPYKVMLSVPIVYIDTKWHTGDPLALGVRGCSAVTVAGQLIYLIPRWTEMYFSHIR